MLLNSESARIVANSATKMARTTYRNAAAAVLTSHMIYSASACLAYFLITVFTAAGTHARSMAIPFMVGDDILAQ